MLTLPRTMYIADGISIDVRNPSWNRPFKVTKAVTHDPKDKNGPRRFFLCKFDCAEQEQIRTRFRIEFMHFGVAATANGIVEGWPIHTTDQEDPDTMTEAQLIENGEKQLRGFLCPKCLFFVQMEVTHKRLGPELVRVTYRCPRCRYSEVDVID